MIVFTYDGTFGGLLTAIFESYERKMLPNKILAEARHQQSFFDQVIHVTYDEHKAERVKSGLEGKAGKKSFTLIYHAFLTEEIDVEMVIFRFVRRTMVQQHNINSNYLDDDVLHLHQLRKKINRERHRMHAFVRFQLTGDNIFYAVVEPDFNVMPVIGDHFVKRYPAQTWLIYDARRHYGIFYDQNKLEYVSFADKDAMELRQLSSSILDEKEEDYQRAWKKYFDSVNIPERKNMKLHTQHVPKRYWKYLSEKNLLLD